MLRQALEDSVQLRQDILENDQFFETFEVALAKLLRCLKEKKKVLMAGNGGSAADAQHFAAELIGRYQRERTGHAAIDLAAGSSTLTAISNDYAFDAVFSRQVQAIGRPGDVLVCISTSGNSPNLIEAAKAAKRQHMHVIGLLGKGGGALKELCDVALVVPHDDTPRIQEVHTTVIHAFCHALDA